MKEKYPKIKMQRAKALLHLIHKTWFNHLQWPTIFIENYFGVLISSFVNRGMEEGIKENKALRLKYTQWVSNPHIYPFPPQILKMGGCDVRDVDSIKIVLSVLNVTRSLRLKPDPNLGIIEDPSVNVNLGKFQEFLKVAIKPWMKALVKTDWEMFHYSTKSGPNGQAMYTSFEDLSLIPPELLQEIKDFGGQKMEDMLSKIFTVDDNIGCTPFELIKAKYKPRKSKGCIRRLAFISDREGKTRTIGVLDYFSQTVLKPLHDSIMTILGRLKADMTFRQEANLISTKGPYFSIDLKAATDSFPVELQEAVLEQLIGPKAKTWKRIMTSYPFKHPYRETPVYYNRGQPMGAYSSWAVFSLTHHLLIQFSASETSVGYPFTDYQVLGDDVVIANQEVGERYMSNLTLFKIPFSPEKTMISDEVYEFAKRWFFKGTEVSPFPVNGLFEESKHYFTLRNLLWTANRKGYPSFENGNPNREFVMQVWDIFGKKSQKDRLIKKFQIFDALTYNDSTKLKDRLNTLYPKDKDIEFVDQIRKRSKVLMSMHDLLSLQEFYNKELDALKKGHVVELYKKQNKDEENGQATPAYEYADVWPPLNVARRLIRQYMRLLDAILKDHREECQLTDPAFENALLVNEVPSFMISRQVINERTARKKLGAMARLTGLIMSLWNERDDPNMNIKYLDQTFGVVIELDFDEWDECMGRVVLEPMSIREERIKNLSYLKKQKLKTSPT